MKMIFILNIIISVNLIFAQSTTIILKGKDNTVEKIAVNKRYGNEYSSDTIYANTKGKFKKKIDVTLANEVTFLKISKEDDKNQKEKITIENTIPKDDGKKSNYEKFMSMVNLYESEINHYHNKAYNSALSDKERIQLQEKIDSIGFAQEEYIKGFISDNTSNHDGLKALQFISIGENFYLFKKVRDELAKKNPSDPALEDLNFQIRQASISNDPDIYGVGSKLPEYYFKDINNNEVALDKYTGQYVLIEFWASWCSPCRAKHPNLIGFYDKYNAKGFEIFSISLDKDYDRWKNAITSDELNWPTQVNGKNVENSLMQNFNFNKLPFNLLVDKKGYIIARDLSVRELEYKLQYIFRN